MTLTFGSLFAGIGGMDLGLEAAGLRCLWQVEIDPYARRVLAKHWPGVRRWRDIKTFLPDTSRERRGAWGPGRVAARRQRRSESPWVSEWRVDLVAGGFPCQDISYAGQGAGLDGERSGLWWEAARVIRTLRPRYVLLENVAALLTRGLDAVLGTLASLGYDAEWHCLPAAYVGAPHIRDRIFILGHAVGQPASLDAQRRRPRGEAGEPGCGAGHVADADRLRERQPQGGVGEVRGRAGDGCEELPDPVGEGLAIGPSVRSDLGQELQAFERTHRRPGGWWYRDPADDPQSGVGRMAHGVPSRVDRLRGLGNAVVPQVAEFWGRLIVERHESGW